MLGVLIALLLASTLYLQIVRSEYAVPFVVMGVAGVLATWMQIRWATGGVPLMGGIAVQHVVTYCTPLLVENKTVEHYTRESLTAGVIQFAVFIVVSR